MHCIIADFRRDATWYFNTLMPDLGQNRPDSGPVLVGHVMFTGGRIQELAMTLIFSVKS